MPPRATRTALTTRLDDILATATGTRLPLLTTSE